MKKAVVIIPVYKREMDQHELMSLHQCCSVLSEYPIVIVKPYSLNLEDLQKEYPFQLESFDDSYFESISAYNRLMLSSEFYERFLAYEYMLIYQLDAYVFRNELENWCEKGFDYIGAPWLLKPKYYKLRYRIFLGMKSIGYKIRKKPFCVSTIGNKVGNGGFSLRKVHSFYEITLTNKDKIKHYLNLGKQSTIYNEDVFWAFEASGFKYPTMQEAVYFSIDVYPALGMEFTNHQLPFGCHAWNRKPHYDFWKKYIMP